MTRLPDRYLEDRALRDAARAVLTEDVTVLRGSLAEEGIASRVSSGVASRISSRVKTGASDVWAQASAQAGERKGVLGVIIAAVILWFLRAPIFDWLDELAGPDTPAKTDDMTGDDAAHGAPEGDTP
ncbi:hypothetical protein [Erythrobacter neustonensis]|uniref:Uncharacterized protein n=1 Tax=Erythrobacter neustonensis TaxID=1112 RepID=A0A192D5Z0_9SPHN|nr:hypothetical protein [Erythrobacter neustonensis]ANK13515.1 hypothetical protein A9D12_11855 [Erythrobacter neustonensis]